MLEPWIAASSSVLLPWPLACGAVAIAVAGFLRGFVGFGSSMVIVIVFSLLYGPVFAVPIAALTGLPSSFQLLPTAIRHSEGTFVLPFAISIFAAAPFGTIALIAIDPLIMKFCISLFVLAMVYMLYRDWRPARPLGKAAFLSIGMGTGLVQGAAGVGGPPVVAVALSRPGEPTRQRANVIATVIALGLCNFPPFLYYGLFTREVIILSLIMIPFYSAGTWFGSRFFAEGGSRHYRNAALLALAIIGFVGLGVSLRNYLLG